MKNKIKDIEIGERSILDFDFNGKEIIFIIDGIIKKLLLLGNIKNFYIDKQLDIKINLFRKI